MLPANLVWRATCCGNTTHTCVQSIACADWDCGNAEQHRQNKGLVDPLWSELQSCGLIEQGTPHEGGGAAAMADAPYKTA